MSEHHPNDQIAPGEPKHGHEHHVADHPHHTAEASAFSAADRASFQSDDYAAGKAVVILMLGIFGTGVLLYSIVAFNIIS